MGLASAVPVIWGAIKTAGAWAGKQLAKEGVKMALKEGAKVAVASAVSKGVDKITDGKDEQATPAYDAEAENKKAQLASAKGARRRIAQQTQTLLTSPLGGLGRVGGGIAKTLLGH